MTSFRWGALSNGGEDGKLGSVRLCSSSNLRSGASIGVASTPALDLVHSLRGQRKAV